VTVGRSIPIADRRERVLVLLALERGILSHVDSLQPSVVVVVVFVVVVVVVVVVVIVVVVVVVCSTGASLAVPLCF